jgi:hypothetical protein
MKNRWLRIAAIAAGWAFLGLVLSLELYFNQRAEMSWSDFAGRRDPPVRPGRDVGLPCALHPHAALQDAAQLRPLGWRHPLPRGVQLRRHGDVLPWAPRGLHDLLRQRTHGFWRAATSGFYGHNLVDIAYYWAVIAFGYGGELQRRFKNEEIRAAQLESRLIEAELKALREQLKPHFLFNTLNTISVLVRDGKNEMAVTLLARLGSLLRMSLDGNHKNETTLRVEMDFLERYIEIQKARFPDRLTVDHRGGGGGPRRARAVAAAPADRGKRDPPRRCPQVRTGAGRHPRACRGRLPAPRGEGRRARAPRQPKGRRGHGPRQHPGAPLEDLRRREPDDAAQPARRAASPSEITVPCRP